MNNRCDYHQRPVFGHSDRWESVVVQFRDCRFERLLSENARSHFRPEGAAREFRIAAIRASYSITLSAIICSEYGILRPNALAVLPLMISSNIVGCSTGRSAGPVPLKILST